jgi:capsular exopolysaccharide synthesis family protein
MTRLSEALDRANQLRDDDITPPGAVALEWKFEAPEAEAGLEPPRGIVDVPRTEAPRTEAPRAVSGGPRALETRFSEDDRRKVVVGPEADSAVVEQYRRLAAVLHHAQCERRARSVMVASAVPFEGKTLTATNLALTLSESYQRRVLLIDADLRRPSIHSMFDLPNDVGLVDAFNHPADGRLPVQSVSPTLWVLTAGRPSPDPMGLLVSEAMQQLLMEATATFDWVVVDTPPVAILSDANLLAGMIDTALLVVHARSTPYPLVQRAVTAIGPSKIPGVVLNRAERPELSDGYGYYADRERWGRPRNPAAWRRWLRLRAQRLRERVS